MQEAHKGMNSTTRQKAVKNQFHSERTLSKTVVEEERVAGHANDAGLFKVEVAPTDSTSAGLVLGTCRVVVG